MEIWQRKRKWMFINHCIGGVAYGLSLNIYFPTEYYYLKNTVKVKNPDFYFGLSQAALFLSGAIASIIGSYYADYTKNIREICLFEDVLNIIGNVMYSLHYSPYLILFGQLLVGTTAARITSSVGEVSRVYETVQITQKLGILGVATTVGAILGPCATFVFQYVDTSIGNWKLNMGNMVAIFMAVFYLFQLILNYFTLHNVSKEYTLKKELLLDTSNENDNMEYEYHEVTVIKALETEDIEELSFNEKYLISLKAIFRHKHIVFCLAMSVLLTYARGLIKIVVPIKGEEYLNWGEIDVATLWVIPLTAGCIPIMILLTILTKYINDFFLYLGSLVILLLSLSLMALLPMIKHDLKATEVTLYCAVTLDLMSASMFHILLRSMLAKFVPENVQSITEGFRNALFEVADIFSGLSILLPVKYLSQTMFAMSLMVSALTGCYIAENKTFKNIKVIDVKYR